MGMPIGIMLINDELEIEWTNTFYPLVLESIR